MGIQETNVDEATNLRLTAQIASIVETAIDNALLIQSSSQGLDDVSKFGAAVLAAEELARQFDILPKGELKRVWHVSRSPLRYTNEDVARRSARAQREALYTQLESGWKQVDNG